METKTSHLMYFRSDFLKDFDKYFETCKDQTKSATDNPDKTTDKKGSKLKGTLRWYILLNVFKYKALNIPQYKQYMTNIEEDLKKTNDLLNKLLQPSNLAEYRESPLLFVFESVHAWFKYLVDFINTNGVQNTYPNIPEYCVNMFKSIHKEKKSYDKKLMDHVSTNIDWIITLLLNNGFHVNSTDREKISVLHYASYYCSLKTIEYLVERGADINAKDKYNQSVLHYACYRNTLDVVKYFVTQGADINAKDDCDRSVLHYACKTNRVDVVQYLVEQGADINSNDTFNMSVLHYACENATPDVVQYLVAQRANVNAKTTYGRSVLHYACEKSALDVVQFLVAQGADISAYDGKTVLHYACKYNSLDVVQYLVEQGADIHVKENDYKTVLHHASEYNTLEVVQYLVAQGADLNAKDRCNKTVLHYACGKNRVDVVQNLVEQGADINAKDTCDRSVLHYACARNTLDVTRYLVERGADINAKDKYNKSVLHYACQWNTLDIAQYLVAQGADINAKDEDNKSVLHHACEYNTVDVVQYLVNSGADVNAIDNDGSSVEMIAVKRDIEILKCISEAQNGNRKSTRHIAIKLDKFENFKYIFKNECKADLLDAVKYNRNSFVDFILHECRSAEVTVELIYASIQNESLSMLRILINKIDRQKLQSITSYKESIWEIANRQQSAEIINFLSKYFPAVKDIFKETPSGRFDERSLQKLRMVNAHCNIFNAHEYAGAGTHFSQGERGKNHGTEFMIGYMFWFLLNIYKVKFQSKISCENSNYGKFDDLVINANNYLMCLQFKSKSRINENTALLPIRQTDLFGNRKNSNFDMYKYFESFLENIDTFTNNKKALYLILYTNQPLDPDMLSCMVEDRSVPLINNIYKFKAKTLEKNIKAFNTQYLHNFESNDDAKQIIELFFKNIYFAVNQLDLKNLDNKIKGLIKELISKGHVDDIYSLVKGQLVDWYKPDKDKSGVYFSEKSILFYFDSIKNKFSDKQQSI